MYCPVNTAIFNDDVANGDDNLESCKPHDLDLDNVDVHKDLTRQVGNCYEVTNAAARLAAFL